MNEDWLEIKEYTGEGYQPLINFGTWRVAILRWVENLLPERIDYLERHTQTDEVFVLLAGQATLVLGGNSEVVRDIYPQGLKPGTFYNVKQSVWHTVLLSEDASILIVEERDTGVENSEYYTIPGELKKEFLIFGGK